MKNICIKLSKLVDVKSIVTICLTAVFCRLSLKGIITSEQFLTIFSTVIAFYFGTQFSKKTEEEAKADDNKRN